MTRLIRFSKDNYLVSEEYGSISFLRLVRITKSGTFPYRADDLDHPQWIALSVLKVTGVVAMIDSFSGSYMF